METQVQTNGGTARGRRGEAFAAFERRGPVVLLGAALFVAAVMLVVAQWRITFFQDTFAFLLDRQLWMAHSIFAPHNEHIVVLPVLITKVLLEVFGMTSNVPEQIAMGITVLVAAVLLFAWLRRRLDPWLATIGAVLFLFLGSAWPVILWPFENEFTLPVVFGLATLLFLDREDSRGDAWACAMLALATISGSLGLSFIVAAFVDLVLNRKERGWRRAYVFALPLLIYLAWYAGYGHEAEHHLTLHNILNSPAYVVEGFASALDSLAGLSTIPVNSPGQNDWGRPLLVGVVALVAFGQWRKPGFSRGFWTVAVAAVSYWLLAALNFVPGREASASRYVYAGAVFVLLMAAELLRGRRFSRKALIVIGAAALVAILPNLAQMKDGSRWEKEQSVFTRSDLGALEIARDTVSPTYRLDLGRIDRHRLVGAGPSELVVRSCRPLGQPGRHAVSDRNRAGGGQGTRRPRARGSAADRQRDGTWRPRAVGAGRRGMRDAARRRCLGRQGGAHETRQDDGRSRPRRPGPDRSAALRHRSLPGGDPGRRRRRHHRHRSPPRSCFAALVHARRSGPDDPRLHRLSDDRG